MAFIEETLEAQLFLFEHVLLAASTRSTAYPPLARAWTRENPAIGHCAMYALAVDERFGRDYQGKIEMGELLYPGRSEPILHFQNYFFEKSYDLSRSQHPAGFKFKRTSFVTAGHILSLPDRELERYDFFKWKVSSLERPDLMKALLSDSNLPTVPSRYP